MHPKQTLLFALGAAFCLAAAVGCDDKSAPGASSVGIESGFITAPDSTKLFYRKVGHGAQAVILPADLFLHPAFDRLAEGRTLYYYDMRNRGQSDAVPEHRANSIQQDILDLESVRAHFQLESVELVGFSYLGLLVMLYAIEHPEHVRRVVQIGPIPLRLDTVYADSLRAGDYVGAMDSTALAEVRRLQAEGLPESDPAEYCRREGAVTRVALVGDPANLSRLNQDICDKPNEWPIRLSRHFARHFDTIQRLKLDWREFQHYEGPVLVVHGRIDRNAAYGSGREWAAQLPNARLVTVPGAAHCAWADGEELVFGAIDRFLAGEWPEAAEEVR